MFRTLSFSFENDFQRLRIELDASNGAMRYRVPESENLDFVQKDDAWKPFEGDVWKLMTSIEALDIENWIGPTGKESFRGKSQACSEAPCIFPESEVKWSLFVEQAKEGKSGDGKRVLEVSGQGSDSYPVNFADLLELFRELLNLPVLLLEL